MKGKATIYKTDGTVEHYDFTEPVTLEFLREAVGGPIEAIPRWPYGVGFCNEEGKILGLPYNDNADLLWHPRRTSAFTDYLVGNVVQITGDDEFMETL